MSAEVVILADEVNRRTADGQRLVDFCDCGADLPAPVDREHATGDVLICDACAKMWTLIDCGHAFVLVQHAPGTDKWEAA